MSNKLLRQRLLHQYVIDLSRVQQIENLVAFSRHLLIKETFWHVEELLDHQRVDIANALHRLFHRDIQALLPIAKVKIDLIVDRVFRSYQYEGKLHYPVGRREAALLLIFSISLNEMLIANVVFKALVQDISLFIIELLLNFELKLHFSNLCLNFLIILA